MLLRSLTKHVKDQNWFAVFLDFFIVVAGILIAFQITEWNERRQDRAEEYQVLRALKDNIATTGRDVAAAISDTETGQASLKILAEYSDGDHDGLSTTDIDKHILYGIYTLPAFEPTMVAYDELRSSGRLGLISSADLSDKLQGLSKDIEALEREEEGLRKMSYETSDPFLLKHVDWRGFTTHSSIQGWERSAWIDPLKDRRDFSAALREVEFQNIVLYRARTNASYLYFADVLSTSLGELETLVDQRLAEFGSK